MALKNYLLQEKPEMKSHPQKNTLLKNADANAASNFFKRVFFTQAQEEFFPPLFFLFFFRHRTGSVLNRKVGASNVNRFVDRFVHNTDRNELRTDSRASGNKVLPKAGVAGFYYTFVLNRTLVFQINSSAETPRLRQYPNR